MNYSLIKDILLSIRSQQDIVGHKVTVNSSQFDVDKRKFEKALEEIHDQGLAEGIRIVTDAGEYKGIKITRLRLTSKGKRFLKKY